MPSVFPNEFDALSNPTSSNQLNAPSHSAQHINANDCIEAIEANLGLNAQGPQASIAARFANNLATSWTPGPHEVASVTMFGAVWASELGLFVMVGQQDSGPDAAIMTSPDGVTWTSRTIPSDVQALLRVAWAPETGVLCATGIDDTSDNITVTSTDGITWVRHLVGMANVGLFRDIAWNGTVFVLVGDFGTVAAVASSPDGVTWTGRTVGAAGNSVDWKALTWNGTLFVSVGELSTASGARVLRSVDGITWVVGDVVVNAKNYDLVGVAWNTAHSIFAAVGENTTDSVGAAFTSTDAITWTLATNPLSGTDAWTSLGSNGIVFYGGVGSTTSEVWVSRDGKHWVRKLASGNGDITDFSNSEDGTIVAVSDGDDFAWTSP